MSASGLARTRTSAADARVTGTARSAPLVVHVIHRLDTGGMENGLVNLVNHMPQERFRHAIVCMTGYTGFSRRVRREDVALYGLGKREGKDLAVHGRLWRLLRRLRPDIVHTRNLATLEAQVTATLAGVRRRVHGEHGWDVGDPDGSNPRNRRLRRLVRPLVGEYIALSRHQHDYLTGAIHVAPSRVTRIVNGVDTGRFHPAGAGERGRIGEASPFAAAGEVVIGAAMRMQPVKGPDVLLDAFIRLLARAGGKGPRVRLVMIGDGPLLPELRRRAADAGVADRVTFPGMRDDMPDVMRGLDLFVVPSHAEGICNTILEAMASGLPVVATGVGGNPDLVVPGVTGTLVPAGDASGLADAIGAYVADPERMHREGRAARALAEQRFSLTAMVDGYLAVYERMMRGAP